MVLKCLDSGSQGNCYILKGERESLVIECGVDFREVTKAVDWHLSEIAGCIVTHRHNDHAKFINEFLKRGIRVLALPDVFVTKRITNKAFAKEIVPLHKYKVGGFTIFPMSVDHDVPCVAYIVEHAEMGRLFFLTDTMMLEYRLPKGIRHMMVEANYSDKVLAENIENGIMPVAMKDRLLHSHMEFGTTKELLRSNNLDNVNEIVLVHLSSRNADGEQFRSEVQKLTGKPTYLAQKGLSLELLGN